VGAVVGPPVAELASEGSVRGRTGVRVGVLKMSVANPSVGMAVGPTQIEGCVWD